MAKKKHKIKLEPTISLILEMQVTAETKNQAIAMGKAYVIRQIAAAFGIDHPAQCNIKFGE